MSSLVNAILSVNALLVYAIVGALVFAEDALFVGFVLPGETAAVLGGVDASRGHVVLAVIATVVVLAAVLGDSVGYQVGRALGPKALDAKPLRRHHARLDDARDFLARRGGAAVFLARFVAFFRAVMPALAGTARMRYPTFLTWNALGGLTWGVGFVLLGYLAGDSYQKVEKTVGPAVAGVVVLLVVVALVVWRIRSHRKENADAAQRS